MDRTLQDELYSQASWSYGAELRRLARGYEANADQQRDLLQEIHLELWRSLVAFDGRCSMRTWVFRIAHNVGASHGARCIRSMRLVDLETLPAVALPADSRAEAERQGSAAMLLKVIHGLKLLDRQVILLYVATKIHRIKNS